MINYLPFALCLVLFYDALALLILPSTVTYYTATDGSMSRFICYLTAAFITGHVLYRFGIKKLPVVWFGLLLLFIVFSSLHSPDIHFEGVFTPKDTGLFNFKPMFECFLYFGLFMAMYSMPYDAEIFDRVVTTLGISGAIMCVYIILQRFGMDQIFQISSSLDIVHFTRNPACGGFISQPLYAASLVTMLAPFMKRLNPWLFALAWIAILVTGNRSGMIAMGILSLYFLLRVRKVAICSFVVYMFILAIVEGIYWTHPQFSGWDAHSDGRLEAWKLMIQDFIHPKFPGIDKSYIITGQGIGAFSIFFPFSNQSLFNQAHNEYLELWRGCSFVGLFLLFKGQFQVLAQTKNNLIFASLLGISFLACTNPVWHISTLAFLTVFLAGLGMNTSYQNGGSR